jgi:uncharacterized membrane protein
LVKKKQKKQWWQVEIVTKIEVMVMVMAAVFVVLYSQE